MSEEIMNWMLARKLMEAFDCALYLNDCKTCDEIRKIINSLDLPETVCESCEDENTKMSAFDYILKQGMCDSCSKRYSEMAEKED